MTTLGELTEETLAIVLRLKGLLEDPQYGLASWQMMVARTLRELLPYIPQPAPKPKTQGNYLRQEAMAALEMRKVVSRMQDSIIYDAALLETQIIEAIGKWLDTTSGSPEPDYFHASPNTLDWVAKQIRAGAWKAWLPKAEPEKPNLGAMCPMCGKTEKPIPGPGEFTATAKICAKCEEKLKSEAIDRG